MEIDTFLSLKSLHSTMRGPELINMEGMTAIYLKMERFLRFRERKANTITKIMI